MSLKNPPRCGNCNDKGFTFGEGNTATPCGSCGFLPLQRKTLEGAVSGVREALWALQKGTVCRSVIFYRSPRHAQRAIRIVVEFDEA